jgi:hypothetical protein
MVACLSIPSALMIVSNARIDSLELAMALQTLNGCHQYSLDIQDHFIASGGRTNDDSGTTMIRRRRMDATCLKLSLVTGRYSPAQTEITDLRQLVRKG